MRGRITSLAILLLLFGCGAEQESTEVDRDLNAIKTDTLRIVITPGKLGIERVGKRERGLEHALLSSFAERSGLAHRFIEAINADSAASMLRSGHADIAAGLYSANWASATELAASCPYNSSKTVLVTLKPDPWYGKYWGHRGFPARIAQDHSDVDSIWTTAQHGIDTIAGKRLLVIDQCAPESIIEQVALGKRKAAVLSKTVAEAYERDFPHLDISTVLEQEIDLVFGMRKNAVHLKGAVDSWLGNGQYWAEIDALTSAYCEPTMRRANGAFSHPHHRGSTFISAFDDAFKMAADSADLDWRFLAALAFKESRFDTSALSNKGALGLMQLVPNTALAMNIDSTMGEAGAILAAAQYLRSLDRIFRKSVPDKTERLGFILASYNAGLAHVLDAQRLAETNGLDPSLWQGHVERTILLLSRAKYYKHPPVRHGYCKGHSVFLFVREVLHYWAHYKSIGVQ